MGFLLGLLLHGNKLSYRLWYILSLALADLYQGEPVAKRVAIRVWDLVLPCITERYRHERGMPFA